MSPGVDNEAAVAVVAAGAGARGAFEAGALSVVVPWLSEQGLAPRIFVGTSAGSINGAMLASVAHLPPAEAADALLTLWRGITLRRALSSPLLGLPETAAAYAGQFLGLRRSHVISLLDTRPLQEFFRTEFAPRAGDLRRNVESGLVAALAVVATDTSARTRVFSDLSPGTALPPTDTGRALDYEAATIDSEHVLASCAIPALFRPVRIGGQWFSDGGVRLNVPITPAIAYGATHVAVVATHPDRYPAPAPAPATSSGHEPDVVDAVVSLLGSALADRMVEDLQTLRKVNGWLVQDGGLEGADSPAYDGPREIRNVFVGPDTREELGRLAAEVYAERFSGGRGLSEFDFRVIHRVIGPREPGDGDLLSYLFFDELFIERAIALGQDHARRVIAGSDPWQ